jgi:hypothetical protein
LIIVLASLKGGQYRWGGTSPRLSAAYGWRPVKAFRPILTALAALAALGGCYSAPVELHNKSSGSLHLPLQGVYKATTHAPAWPGR